MAQLQQRKLKGLTGAAIFDKTVVPKLAYIIDTPTSPEIDPGIEEQLNETTSELGEIVIESTLITAQRPTISMTVPGLSPTVLALRNARKLQAITGTATSAVEKRIRLTASNKTFAGATSGKEGNGMVADQVASLAWVFGGLGIPTALTRQAHASFDPAVTDDSFSQGADGAYKFSDNLVGSDVMYTFPQSGLNSLELSEDSLTDLEINFTAVMRDLRLFRVEIPSATIDLGGSGNIPLGPGEVSLQARITYDGSTCTPLRYKFLEQLRAC